MNFKAMRRKLWKFKGVMGQYLMLFGIDTSARSRTRYTLVLIALSWICATKSHAVVFYDTADSSHNTTAPTGIFADSGWQYEGLYGSYLGTAIAPQYFITAQHFGPQGSTFTQSGIFTGGSDVIYNVDGTVNGGTGYWDIAGTDLRIFKVQEYFSTYAPLYTGSLEIGMTMVTMGRGGPRGDDVLVSGVLHGWEAGAPDGTPRWGSNTVSGVYSSVLGDLLMASFSASGTSEEATLSNGDSGGGVFVNDGGIWKLAGINYSVDGRFAHGPPSDATSFDAALFDRGGLYQGSDAFGWTFITDVIPDTPLTDIPSNMYASRISTNAAEIMSIAVVPEPQSVVLVMLAGLWGATRRRRVMPPV